MLGLGYQKCICYVNQIDAVMYFWHQLVNICSIVSGRSAQVTDRAAVIDVLWHLSAPRLQRVGFVVNEGGGCKATAKRMSVRRSRMHDSQCKVILLATSTQTDR